MEEKGYSPIIIDHFKNPRNIGEMDNPDAVGESKNPACGDTMRLFIKVKDSIIIEAKFLTFGCSAAIASSSITTEMIKGKSIDEASSITDKMVLEALGGLPPSKIHASHLAEKAVKSAIMDYKRKNKLA